MEQTTLYYRAGGSDKVYQASLVEKDGGFVVDFAYGRRGSALKTGTKTPASVDYGQAKKIFDSLVRQKTAKGYTPGEDGAPYRQTGNENRSSGIACQLLHPVEDEEEANRLLADPTYCLQEKHDGRRLLVRKEGNTIEGINRRGLTVALAVPLFEAVRALPGDCLLDGEALGETLVVFDLLRSDGAEVGKLPYSYRLTLLQALVAEKTTGPLQRVETVFERVSKDTFVEALRRKGAEGVVFKNLDAPYTPGREGHRHQFKYKFVETASFIAAGPNGGKQSVGLQLYRGDALIPAGNVTIPPNAPVPPPGTVVEVRYLYAFPESGSVCQPVYLGSRDDIAPDECTVDQLKYKTEARRAIAV